MQQGGKCPTVWAPVCLIGEVSRAQGILKESQKMSGTEASGTGLA